MADSDIFVSNDVQLDVDFGEIFVIDQGIVIKVVAKKYDPTKTYVVGEYVIYQEKLYKCNTAIEEPEEFNAEKWNNVLLADEVQIANANIALKANINDVYDKSAVDSKVTNLNNAIALKANSNDVYAKNETYNQTEVDTALGRKADADTVYTKEEIDNTIDDIADDMTDLETALDTKADKSTTYTKTEIDTGIYKKTETYNKNEVDGIINNLPAPMIFKGTLGVNGTITDLPTASADNEGFTYKVITDGTYTSISAKVGDMFTSNGSAWVHIPSGDETFTDTWRSIKVNGAEQLTGSITSGSVDFKNGTNSTAVFDPSDNSIKVNVDGYTQSQIDIKLSTKANQADVTTALNNKADKSTTYTKTEVNTALALKADKSTTYTKTEVDNLVTLIGTASGAIATFETNMANVLQAVKCEINAKQDLHGEDKPYPAGGGVNIWDEQWENGGISEADGSTFVNPNTIRSKNYIPCTPNTNFYYYCGSGDLAFRICYYDSNKNFISCEVIVPTNRIYQTPANCAFIKFGMRDTYGTTYKNDISINNPATDTQYHPYENVCPIEGFTEANITRCGVNLWDEEYQTGYWDVTNGNHYNSAGELCSKNLIRVMPNTSYYFYRGYSSNRGDILYYDINGNYLHQKKEAAGNASFTTPEECYYIRFNLGGDYGNVYNNDVSINYPNTDTTYHPYTGNTYTIAFGQTVYGCVLDVTRGKLSVTWTGVDLGSLNWYKVSAIPYPYFSAPIDEAYKYISGNTNSKCSNYTPASIGDSGDTQGYMILNINYVRLRDEDYYNVDENTFKTAMSGVMLIYELATPFDIDLTPQQIEALLGVNNVWHDGNGNTEVKYLNSNAEDTVNVAKNVIEQTNLSDLADIPNPPTTDGNYRLKVTILSGKATYSWEEIT